jgi:hypothetical protein
MITVESEERNRLNKLDSFFLWVASLSGIGFTIFISYLKLAWAPYVPIFILIGYALGIGYLKATVFSNSFTERIRGWNYLLLGLIAYFFLILVRFVSPFTDNLIPNSNIYLQPLVVVPVIIIYIYSAEKKTIPWIYANFGKKFGVTTKRILNRSILAAIFLGAILYVIALMLIELKVDFVLLVYLISTIFLIFPLFTEEKRINKLIPLEKYDEHIEVESIIKRKFENFFLALLGVAEISLIVGSQLFSSIFQGLILLGFVVFFVIAFFGYVFGLYYRDRGDMITEKDSAKSMPEEDLRELRLLIIKANS